MTVKANPEIPTAYSAQQVEGRWTEFWEERRCFVADPTADRPAFSITMPPPNVTGVLHMGHALVSTLQDIFSRWKRMQGYEVLWLPGCDHAGISTQTVVERHLLLKTGKKRSEFSREEFLEHVWSWKEHSESSIVEQLRKMGSSCDWSRWCFTMDAQKNRAVRKVFEELYNEGLIYRGDYIVNWDCVTQTAIADDEVEYEEGQGNLWHFR
ncbi:MAG: class I tRNA ligase family protein [Chlamydiia bacterium]|nr:class I tRNA ligase family protein [Chlamydiia bacterium]